MFMLFIYFFFLVALVMTARFPAVCDIPTNLTNNSQTNRTFSPEIVDQFIIKSDF
jgi:hypothetical protein